MNSLRSIPSLFLCATMLFHGGAISAEPLTVLCVGDSITEGKQPVGLKPGERWVNRIEMRSKGSFQCINEGKGGRPASAVDEFKAVLNRHPNFDVLVLALGANDARDDRKEGEKLAARVKASLENMVAAAKKAQPNAAIVLAGPYNINPSALKKNANLGSLRDANLRAIGPEVEALAREQGIAFVNFYGVLPAETLLTDGVHPDANGHAKIEAVLWPVLEQALAKKR